MCVRGSADFAGDSDWEEDIDDLLREAAAAAGMGRLRALAIAFGVTRAPQKKFRKGLYRDCHSAFSRLVVVAPSEQIPSR